MEQLNLKQQIRIAIGSAALIFSLGFASNTYAETNTNSSTQESIFDACQSLPTCLTFVIAKTSENRLDDAFSALPNMLGLLAKHDYFKNTLLTKISSKAMQGLQKSIQDKLTIQLEGTGLTKLGIDVAADIFIDEVSIAIKNSTGSDSDAGWAWFLMKQSYALGNVYVDSKEMPVQVAFLKNQAGLLVSVIKKDIEAYKVLKKDDTDAAASQIRNLIMIDRSSNLLADYQKYFQAEKLSDKNALRTKIINNEKKLLAGYLNGKAYNIFVTAKKTAANAAFNSWKADLAGRLVKEEMTTRANISALVLAGKYEEAKKASTSFFGSESYAINLITELPKVMIQPDIVITGNAVLDLDGVQYARIVLKVKNKQEFSNDLFRLSPELPACGLNTLASRTWVNIFDNRGNYLYGFCALDSSDSLAEITFNIPKDSPPPSGIYITLNDRLMNVTYKSNTVPLIILSKDESDLVDSQELLDLVNQRRKNGVKCGNTEMPPVSPVVWQKQLESAAIKHSQDMEKQNYLAHTNKLGLGPGDRIEAEGYIYANYGENAAQGYVTSEGVVQGWIKSEGHCKNLMNGDFTEMGVGKSGLYWTQLFGRQKDQKVTNDDQKLPDSSQQQGVVSYTKIANDGSALPDNATLGANPKDWACTRDNKTGLIWEVKTDDDGLRDIDNERTWDDSFNLATDVNKQGLCGAKDWRMPNNEELKGLVYCSDNQTKTLGKEENGDICTGSPFRPTINTTYFPDVNVYNDWFWSSSPSADDSRNAWAVSFYHSYNGTSYKYGTSKGVRLVRSGQ